MCVFVCMRAHACMRVREGKVCDMLCVYNLYACAIE